MVCSEGVEERCGVDDDDVECTMVEKPSAGSCLGKSVSYHTSTPLFKPRYNHTVQFFTEKNNHKPGS